MSVDENFALLFGLVIACYTWFLWYRDVLIVARRRSGFLVRALSYRFRALLGLSRNSAGGFGSVIPIPTAGGTGFG